MFGIVYQTVKMGTNLTALSSERVRQWAARKPGYAATEGFADCIGMS